MVLVAEVRDEGQRLLRVEGHTLRASRISLVHTVVPRIGNEFTGIELIYIFVEDVHVDASLPVQLVMLLIKAKQAVVQLELRRDVVSTVIELSQVG